MEEEMATHSNILAWKIHGQRSLVGYSPWSQKELDTTEHTCTQTHTHTRKNVVREFNSVHSFSRVRLFVTS